MPAEYKLALNPRLWEEICWKILALLPSDLVSSRNEREKEEEGRSSRPRTPFHSRLTPSSARLLLLDKPSRSFSHHPQEDLFNRSLQVHHLLFLPPRLNPSKSNRARDGSSRPSFLLLLPRHHSLEPLLSRRRSSNTSRSSQTRPPRLPTSYLPRFADTDTLALAPLRPSRSAGARPVAPSQSRSVQSTRSEGWT